MTRFLRPIRLPAWAWFLQALLLALVLTALFVVGSFRAPQLAPMDPGHYHFTTFYFTQHFSWWPWPNLELQSDWSLFPFGGDHTYMHWGFERDLLSSRLLLAFGPGPWHQGYFLLSLAISALGAFWLLCGAHGPTRAALVAFGVSFGNLYVVRKFPWHMPYACPHWALLGILADFELVRRHWQREPWPLPLVLARALFTVASFGSELGYTAGFGLTSLLFSILWIGAVELVRRRRRTSGARSRANVIAAWHAAARERRVLVGLLGLGIVLASWLYLPLLLQVYLSSRAQAEEVLLAGFQWEHPARLLIPILPGFDAKAWNQLLGDSGELFGFHFSPGLWLTLLATTGLILGRRRAIVAVPALLFFLLAATFDPATRTTLDLLPWFQYARAPGRATIVFPALLAIAALALPPWRQLARWSRALVLAVLGLGGIEVVSGWTIIHRFSPAGSERAVFLPTPAFLDAMAQIRATSGAGILEWPLVITNNGGAMGTFFNPLAGSFQLAQFHGKRSVGSYMSRMPAANLRPFQDLGFPELFMPTARKEGPLRRQRQDFTAEQWRLLAEFYARHDFCGLLVYADLLPATTREGFYQRFGHPVTSFEMNPGPGRVEFIPKRSTV